MFTCENAEARSSARMAGIPSDALSQADTSRLTRHDGLACNTLSSPSQEQFMSHGELASWCFLVPFNCTVQLQRAV